MEDLKGKTAFITGGASGLGLAMAHAFGEAGMQIMLADIDEPPLAQAVADLESRQIKVSSVICDVVSRAAVQAAAEKTIETFGKVHIVCNNAGVGAGGPMDQVKPSDWDWVIDVNLNGLFYCNRLAARRMADRGGVIVNLALFFAYHVLWPDGFGGRFEAPSALIAAVAAVALFLAGQRRYAKCKKWQI
jgi:NAD(P)-dependent dehydrogenase (short-subunit alcohol dehydrogenase family)